ncbi:MAG: Cytidine deaminase [Firmicutes bacterium ADurb.Bin193]|nr:MAG: Cytidine deaminase [Firmicutes bacterium ADurb.Bin193]
MTDNELIKIADSMREKSYAPYSNFRVGAALLCGDGSVITGCNVENISFGATICAERTAFVKAISEGKSGFIKLAISASGGEIPTPCGICRQFMSEFAYDNFKVICKGDGGGCKAYTLSSLMPHSFKAEGLK